MKVLVVLQNAWAYEAAESWEYRSWVRALKRSRSGQRLARVFGMFWDEVRFGNTTAKVGEGPNSQLPPDLDHIKKMLENEKPDIVVAVGLQAEKAMKVEWSGPLLVMPHPACRVLTNKLLDDAYQLLYGQTLYAERKALRQGRGITVVEDI